MFGYRSVFMTGRTLCLSCRGGLIGQVVSCRGGLISQVVPCGGVVL